MRPSTAASGRVPSRSVAISTNGMPPSPKILAYGPSEGPATVTANSGPARCPASSRTWAGPPPRPVETTSSRTRSGPAISAAPKAADKATRGLRKGLREQRAENEERAPGRVCPAPHRPPSDARLRRRALGVPRRGDTARQEPADDQQLRQVRHTRHAAHAHPQIVVLGDGEGRVVASRLLHHGPPHHDRGVHERVAADERAPDLRVARWRAQDRDLATGGVDLSRGRAEQPDVRVPREEP